MTDKGIEDYTPEELAKLDEGTIADLMWDYKKKYGQYPNISLSKSLLNWENDHRMNHWD